VLRLLPLLPPVVDLFATQLYSGTEVNITANTSSMQQQQQQQKTMDDILEMVLHSDVHIIC